MLTAHFRNGSLHYEITVVRNFRGNVDDQIISFTEVSLYAVSFQILTTIESTFAIWWRTNLRQRLGSLTGARSVGILMSDEKVRPAKVRDWEPAHTVALSLSHLIHLL